MTHDEQTPFGATTPQVTLQQPAQAKVTDAAEAINDEMLVDVAMDKFGGYGGAGGDVASKTSTTAPKAVKTSVVGVAKGPMNHLVRFSLSVTGRGVHARLGLDVLLCPETHHRYLFAIILPSLPVLSNISLYYSTAESSTPLTRSDPPTLLSMQCRRGW